MIALATVLLCISLVASQGMVDAPTSVKPPDTLNVDADTEDYELDLAKEFLYAVTDPPLIRERRDTEVEASGDAYPTEVPRIEGAVFVFKVDFTIHNMTVEDFNKTERENFTILLHNSFSGVLGFHDVSLTNVTKGSVILSTACEIDAGVAHAAANDETQNATLKQDLLTACFNVVNFTKYEVYNDSDACNERADGLVDDALDLCNAEGAMCPWGSRCDDSTCVHLCDDVDCGPRGSCQLGGTTIAEPVCKCGSDDWYNYIGARCTESEFRWETVSVISGSIGGAVVVLLGTCLAISCYRRRRKKPKDNFSVASFQSEETQLEPNSGNGRYGSLFGGFGRNVFMNSYFASTTSPGATPSYKLYRSDSVWGPNEIDEQFPDFVPRLDHIDPDIDRKYPSLQTGSGNTKNTPNQTHQLGHSGFGSLKA